MPTLEIMLVSLQTLLLLVLAFIVGVQLIRRLDHVLEILRSKQDADEGEQADPLANLPDYATPAILRELRRQKESLRIQQTPESKERSELIEGLLSKSWQFAHADNIGLVLLRSKEGISIEKIIKDVHAIQLPHLPLKDLGFEMVRQMKISVEYTLMAFIKLAFLSKENELYKMTEEGQRTFEFALGERIDFEKKFLSLYSDHQDLHTDYHGNHHILFIQKDTDDASEVSGGATCAFSIEDENIYLGQCYKGEPITAGFRFVDVGIPSKARIERAYLEFVSDGPYSNSISLVIQAENRGSTETFSDENQPKDRPVTETLITWQIAPESIWHLGAIHTTPDISNIIQEVVNRSDWHIGNSLTILVKGDSSSDKGEHRRVLGFRRTQLSQEYSPLRLVVHVGISTE
jgi:hypothetical protein